MPKKQISRFLLLAAIMVLNIPAFADNLPTLHQVYATVQAGRLDEAKKMMTLVIQAHPDSAKAHYVDAEILLEQGHVKHAKTELNTAQRLAPGLPFAKPKAVQDLESRIALWNSTVHYGIPDSNGLTPVQYTYKASPHVMMSFNDMHPECKKIWARLMPEYPHKKEITAYFKDLNNCASDIEIMNLVYNPDDGKTKTVQPTPAPIRIYATPVPILIYAIQDISKSSDPIGECLKMSNGVIPVITNAEDSMVYFENRRFCGMFLEEMDREDKAQQH